MVSPSLTSKPATVVRSSPRVSTGVRNTVMSGPEIACKAPSAVRLTQGISMPNPKRITSCICSLTLPVMPRTSRTTSEALPRGGMKSISATTPFAVSKRVSRISVLSQYRAGRFYNIFRRLDQPSAVPVGAEQGCETGIGIEHWPAQPVDRTVAPDQRRGLAIADQAIVFDSAGQILIAAENVSASDRCARPFPGCCLQRWNVNRRHHLVDRKRQPPWPVRMLVHGAGNIGLVGHAQHIFNRYREQAGFGPRQKTCDGIEIMIIDAMITQHLG